MADSTCDLSLSFEVDTMMNRLQLVGKTLAMAAGVAVAVLAMSGTASALSCPADCPDFTINPNFLAPGNGLSTSLVADDLQGNYQEIITFSGTSTSGTWSATGYAQLGTIIQGSTAPSPGNAYPTLTSGDSAYYELYATFAAGGTYTVTTDGAGHLILGLTANSSSATLYSDTGFNDTYNAAAATVTPSGDGLDKTLATATFVIGGGTADLNTNIGAYTLTMNTFLTADGKSFFIAPAPVFYLLVNLTGQFTPGGALIPGTNHLSNSVDTIFSGTAAAVPEPATLGLLGFGLVGLARRRFGRKA
jgi:hypothetical protein